MPEYFCVGVGQGYEQFVESTTCKNNKKAGIL